MAANFECLGSKPSPHCYTNCNTFLFFILKKTVEKTSNLIVSVVLIISSGLEWTKMFATETTLYFTGTETMPLSHKGDQNAWNKMKSKHGTKEEQNWCVSRKFREPMRNHYVTKIDNTKTSSDTYIPEAARGTDGFSGWRTGRYRSNHPSHSSKHHEYNIQES